MVRQRTTHTKGTLLQSTVRLTAFKLVMVVERTWHRLEGENRLPKVVQSVKFGNGVDFTNTPAQNAA